MSAPDMLEIINGPEDGTEFPINRAPVIVGVDLGCAVHIRLDESIESQHARLTAVPDGYRVRKLNGGRLLVDGKRTGFLRSRILRDGGVLEVGNTELFLRCAPDGLATRSRGLPVESDVFWALRTFGKRVVTALWSRRRGVRRRRWRKRLILLVAIVVGVSVFWPGLLYWLRVRANYYAGWIGDRLADVIGNGF